MGMITIRQSADALGTDATPEGLDAWCTYLGTTLGKAYRVEPVPFGDTTTVDLIQGCASDEQRDRAIDYVETVWSYWCDERPVDEAVERIALCDVAHLLAQVTDAPETEVPWIGTSRLAVPVATEDVVRAMLAGSWHEALELACESWGGLDGPPEYQAVIARIEEFVTDSEAEA